MIRCNSQIGIDLGENKSSTTNTLPAASIAGPRDGAPHAHLGSQGTVFRAPEGPRPEIAPIRIALIRVAKECRRLTVAALGDVVQMARKEGEAGHAGKRCMPDCGRQLVHCHRNSCHRNSERLYRRAASDSGEAAYVYSPPVGKQGRGRVLPFNTGPQLQGLADARIRLERLIERGLKRGRAPQ